MGKRMSAVSYSFKKMEATRGKQLTKITFVILLLISLFFGYKANEHLISGQMPSDENYKQYEDVLRYVVSGNMREVTVSNNMKVSFEQKGDVQTIKLYNKYTRFSVTAIQGEKDFIKNDEFSSFLLFGFYRISFFASICFVAIFLVWKILFSITKFFFFFFGDFILFYKERRHQNRVPMDYDEMDEND